ncbi:uncharacterized protein LOC131255458 [Magnolia sinica]|uniref:uncharacterized protein LOC131255458 n=1 Tax=Magnolia sinica TaxID=86752 RepID=UPI002658605B|nr:uncharacterized protein LOC131255458 [Magnolia sinica]
MAAIPSPLSCICRSYSRHSISLPSSASPFLSLPSLHSYSHTRAIVAFPSLPPKLKSLQKTTPIIITRAVSEETLIPEEEGAAPPEENATAPPEENATALPEEQTVSVPVSPSDVLTMFFKVEGTMNESAIPTVSRALEETDGVSDLKVQVLEGIASVELTKQTTVQATGVASNLIEIIQGTGFKLQTLNLSFEDEEDTSNK